MYERLARSEEIYPTIETVVFGAQIVPFRKLLGGQDSGIKPLVFQCVESAIRSLQCLKVCLIRRPEGTLTRCFRTATA